MFPLNEKVTKAFQSRKKEINSQILISMETPQNVKDIKLKKYFKRFVISKIANLLKLFQKV
jgi:hypothetical protein